MCFRNKLRLWDPIVVDHTTENVFDQLSLE